jgi:Family of unknown function (DUF6092)
MAEKMVLSEDEALELVAFLVTSARTQVDEAAEYGPLRLLTAASRLAELIAERVSPEMRAFLMGPLKQIPDLAVRTTDPTGYVAALDAVCRAVGEHLVAHFGLDRTSS